MANISPALLHRAAIRRVFFCILVVVHRRDSAQQADTARYESRGIAVHAAEDRVKHAAYYQYPTYRVADDLIHGIVD